MTMTDTTIRPFEVHVPEEDLADLRRRVAATQWPEKETVADRPIGHARGTTVDVAPNRWYGGATSAIATAACPAAGRCAWHRAQGGGAEGGYSPSGPGNARHRRPVRTPTRTPPATA